MTKPVTRPPIPTDYDREANAQLFIKYIQGQPTTTDPQFETTVNSAIVTMIRDGFVYFHGNGRISLTDAGYLHSSTKGETRQ
jgi:hypothetical protein